MKKRSESYGEERGTLRLRGCVVIAKIDFYSSRHAGLDPASRSISAQKYSGFRVKPGIKDNL